jgi:hypothetical protein
MRGLVRTTSLWPGLAELWLRGSVWGLSTALAFAVGLNFALLATFAPDRVGSRFAGVGGIWTAVLAWVFVLSFWIVGVRTGLRTATRSKGSSPAIDPELEARFTAAQQEYLRGHWIEAETLLMQLLVANPHDCEAKLLLASVERRSGRPNDARRTLEQLADMPSAGRWRQEIEREIAHIDASAAAALPQGTESNLLTLSTIPQVTEPNTNTRSTNTPAQHAAMDSPPMAVHDARESRRAA